MDEKIVLCGANSYQKKYYFNSQFKALPENIRQELQIMDGNLEVQVSAEEGDYLFDEIGSGLKIRQYQLEKRELLESLELFYRVVFLGESIEDQE